MSGKTHEQLYDAFGAYVRSQRLLARLTLRQAAELASISNPYLSQIEHGLTLPSISVLRALAKALSVSGETMLLRAAGIARPESSEHPNQTEESIRQDPRLNQSQKHALLTVLSSFVDSSPGPAVRAEAASGEAVSGEAVAGEAFAGEALSEVAGQEIPDISRGRAAGSATAGRVTSHRRKGV